MFNQDFASDNTSFLGQLAAIEANSPYSPRYNPDANNTFDINNYLLLCQNHHRIVDKQPEIYTVEWLKKIRHDHLKKIAEIIAAHETPKIKLDEKIQISLEEAIKIWKSNRENSSEEFWQILFQKCPSVLAQVFPQSMFQFGSKCYVGGKSINNSGGNIVDFIYANKLTRNVVLIEIKTPKTSLLGKKYRANAYSISEELSGAVIQLLNYKEQLMKDFYNLNHNGEDSFVAFNPKCLIISGSVDSEIKNQNKLKSFELFRNDLANIEIITYDELFQRTQDILDIFK